MIRMTRSLPLIVAAALAAAPVSAQQSPEAGAETERGFSLIEEGAKILLEHFFDQAEPAMKDIEKGLTEAMRDFGPVLKDLAEMAGDLHNYHAPEKLPNGDIILRRKTPQELAAPPGGEIDL